MPKPVVQIPVDEVLISKLAKAQKELKMSSKAETGRSLLEYVLENDITELKTRMEKTRLERLYHEAEEKASYALQAKEEIGKKLEKLGA